MAGRSSRSDILHGWVRVVGLGPLLVILCFSGLFALRDYGLASSWVFYLPVPCNSTITIIFLFSIPELLAS